MRSERAPGVPGRRRGLFARIGLLLAVASLSVLLLGSTVASGHLGHDDPHPGDPLVPPEVPIWFRPGVGGLGILLAFVAARASAGGRVSDWIAAAGVVLGVALLLVALAARPGWF